MNCPVCTLALVMTERQGIEIDYCPKCRGVWLDRGELDKIVERSAQNDSARPAQPAAPPAQGYAPPQGKDDSHHGYPYRGKDDSHHGYQYKKKKSWLGELFD